MNKKNREKFNKEILELKKLKGMERVADVRLLIDYIKSKEGENGFEKFKKDLFDNYDFIIPDIKKIPMTNWISESIPHIIMVSAFRFFNWKEKDIFEMGENAIAYSKTLKTFLRYFISIEKTIQRIIDDWNKYYTEGSPSLVNFNKNKKEAIIVIKNFKTHPLLCIYLSGIMEKIIKLTTGSEKVTTKETKCVFKGDDYHEFKFNW